MHPSTSEDSILMQKQRTCRRAVAKGVAVVKLPVLPLPPVSLAEPRVAVPCRVEQRMLRSRSYGGGGAKQEGKEERRKHDTNGDETVATGGIGYMEQIG